MTKIAIITAQELGDTEENPTNCWSALRGVNECQKCERFINQDKGYPLKCKPHLTHETKELLSKREGLRTIHNLVLKELESIRLKLEGGEKEKSDNPYFTYRKQEGKDG